MSTGEKLMNLTFDSYASQQAAFAKYPDSVGIVYPILGFISEVAEVASKLLAEIEKVAVPPEGSVTAFHLRQSLRMAVEAGKMVGVEDKRVRDTTVEDADRHYCEAVNTALKGLTDKTPIIKELGDSLWMISDISKHLNVNLDFVAQTNLDKLNKRVISNTISGNGDER